MKIVFTGPESTGKTSVSISVAEQMGGEWYPEYAREFLLSQGGKYTYEDIEKIGLEQEKQRSQPTDNTFQIYDTGTIVLYIWSMFKYGKCAPAIKKQLIHQNTNLYFLCSPEGIPWEEDPLRENPNQRNELFNLYHKTLLELNANFILLKGNKNERINTALKVIKEQIKC